MDDPSSAAMLVIALHSQHMLGTLAGIAGSRVAEIDIAS